MLAKEYVDFKEGIESANVELVSLKPEKISIKAFPKCVRKILGKKLVKTKNQNPGVWNFGAIMQKTESTLMVKNNFIYDLLNIKTNFKQYYPRAIFFSGVLEHSHKFPDGH
jgi:hypothetical protein